MTGKHPTGLCDQCQIPENAEHFLVYCTKSEIQRMISVKDMSEIGLTGSGFKNITGIQ